MTHPDQFMIYHLYEWDQQKQKYKKKPVGLRGEPLAADGGIPTSPDRAAVAATVAQLGTDYRLGLWLHPDSRFFFLDLDENAVSNGQLTPMASAMAAPFISAGCYFEASSSGRGAHIIGRYTGQLQPHASSRKKVHPHEFFFRDRGCVLNPTASAGSWDIDATHLLPALLNEYFPPRAQADELLDVSDQPRPEWRGPTDDNELMRRALSATGSAAARLGGKATLSDLWHGRCSHDSESDMALASHLAFWTGCHVSRIERLMRASPLAAHRVAKWNSHRTYLRELTITMACATTRNVYIEPQRVDTAAALLGVSHPPSVPVVTDAVVVSPITDWFELTEQTVTKINTAGTLRELFEEVIPGIRNVGFPPVHRQTVVGAIIKKSDSMGSKQSVTVVRDLIAPPIDQNATLQVVPEWAQSIVYVLACDKYFDTSSATLFSGEGLRAAFSRNMPMKSTGSREDVVQWLRERWNLQTVEDIEYRPDQPPVFMSEGRTFANGFLASSMPAMTVGSQECSACIELFQLHLYAVVNRRDDLYRALLGWLAHNVQRPGIKIRWSPLLKGVQGDGKSIFGDLLFAAMGRANVKMTSPATLQNSGGFTDWAAGRAVNFIEEIRLEGKDRRKLYNAMKIFNDGRIDLNMKGRPAAGTLHNVTNHWANTNHHDAVPVEKGERRWCVVFTPWESADEAARIKGLRDADDLARFFKRLGASMRSEPGAWRSWLGGIDLSQFDADGRAPWTQEREAMRSGSEDYVEQTVRDVIERGGIGITPEVFCSSSLMGRVQVDLGEKPDTRTWNRILTDIGYTQAPQVWWNNKTRRVWVKSAMTRDEILEKLNFSALMMTNR